MPEPAIVADTCRAAIAAYWPAESRATAEKVMLFESGDRSNAHNYNPATGDDSYSCFQINRYGYLANSRPSATWLMNPENNVKYALGMYRAQGWQPWANTARKLGIPH